MKLRSLPGLLGALTILGPGGLAMASMPANTASAAGFSIVHRPVHVTGVRNDDVESTNWSGYAVSPGSSTDQFTSVTGSWIEPTATCAKRSNTYASFWVGLDGYSSNSVEQLGTDSDCSRGTPSYYAWYEMYPANSVSLSKSQYQISAGDSLTASVTRSGTSYTLMLSDKAANGAAKWTFAQVETGSDANSSAEWVAEAPELCNVFYCQLASLTNFGSVTMSGGQAADGGSNSPISGFAGSGGPHEMTMVTSSGVVKAQPSGLTQTTNGSVTTSAFSDTWHHS
jgi:Peptidase A4 family